jgi:hypothetical protein
VAIAFLPFSFLGGCAGISHGIKVYPQKIYLFVNRDTQNPEKDTSRIVSLPDLKNGYEVKPWSFMSKHNFTVKIAEAQVTEVTSDQDSTAALALLQKIVEVGGQLGLEALKQGAAAKAVADIDMGSSLGLPSGIYEFDEKGMFRKVSP